MFAVGEDMLVKKFSLSDGQLEELQLEDMSEEIYAVSFCGSKDQSGLSMGGEKGVVYHVFLDGALNLKMDTMHTLLDLGAPINSL